MKNKLLRLAELIQEDCPEDLLELFRSNEKSTLEQRLELIGRARTFHQHRSETLWLQAEKKRTAGERRAAALAELAAFVCAYLTGEAGEYADSASEALKALGRHGDLELISSLARR